jgi:SHAQKYF class myb-like DNA-binding protein
MNQHTLSTFSVPPSVFVTRASSNQGNHSGVSNVSKKRNRSEGSKQLIQIPRALESFERTISSLPVKPVVSFAPTTASRREKSVEKLGTAEIELTKEQIDDVIDTTLPTNFSFSLPVKQLSPKPVKDAIAIHSPSRKKKKQRPSPPPMPVVVTTTTSPSPAASSKEEIHSPTSGTKQQRLPSPSMPVKLTKKPLSAWKNSDTSESSSMVSSPSMIKKRTSSGRWTQAEHEAFLEGLNIYGREWKKVALNISTRTSAQIRSHAQKYFAKLSRDELTQAASSLSSHSDAIAGTSGAAAAMNVDAAMKNEYPTSVLQRFDKILKDPKGAEAEIADTLKRLRQRYDELHNKMEKKMNLKFAADKTGDSLQQTSRNVGDSSSAVPSFKTPTKFTFAASPSQNVVEGHDQDVSATTSALSPVRSSLRLSDEALYLHSRELIALTVLGGELYRSESCADFADAKSPPTHAVGGEEAPRHSSSPDLGALLAALTKASPTKSDSDSH